MTCKQAKWNLWFQYRAGRITASWFKQVLGTDPHQPSLSLLSSICYPDIHKFSTPVTSWGCKHEKEALLAYKSWMTSHEGFTLSSCGFFVSIKHPFLGASPDALIQCDCCGKGVVEIKCPLCNCELSFGEASVGVWNFCLDELPGGKLKLKYEHSYYYHCQMQLFVTRRGYCDFVVWSSKEMQLNTSC